MAEPLVFGRVTDPDEINLDPIVVKIIGHTIAHEEVEETIRFRPMPPTWAAMEMARNVDAEGRPSEKHAGEFLDAAVLAEDRERWIAFLSRDDVMIQGGTVPAIYMAVVEEWGKRPTMSPPGSSGGPKPRSRTSRGAARAKGSTSGNSD